MKKPPQSSSSASKGPPSLSEVAETVVPSDLDYAAHEGFHSFQNKKWGSHNIKNSGRAAVVPVNSSDQRQLRKVGKLLEKAISNVALRDQYLSMAKNEYEKFKQKYPEKNGIVHPQLFIEGTATYAGHYTRALAQSGKGCKIEPTKWLEMTASRRLPAPDITGVAYEVGSDATFLVRLMYGSAALEKLSYQNNPLDELFKNVKSQPLDLKLVKSDFDRIDEEQNEYDKFMDCINGPGFKESQKATESDEYVVLAVDYGTKAKQYSGVYSAKLPGSNTATVEVWKFGGRQQEIAEGISVSGGLELKLTDAKPCGDKKLYVLVPKASLRVEGSKISSSDESRIAIQNLNVSQQTKTSWGKTTYCLEKP